MAMWRTTFLVVACMLALTSIARAEANTWKSDTTGADLPFQVIPPPVESRPQPTAIYLKNLSMPRLGAESDDAILADLTAQGLLVVIIDYGKHEKAAGANLVADVLKLRRDLTAKDRTWLAEWKVNGNFLFIIREGFRLKRDIEFARDAGRVLRMDLFYPADPERPVSVLVEFSCDNGERMGSGSLLYCQDTLVEMAQLHGFASAMADHPVKAPYKGLDDPWPAVESYAIGAADKLRSLKDELPLNGKVGAMGFSRAATYAAMLAAKGHADAALVYGNRFDYLSLTADDPMLARFIKAWGDPRENRDAWVARSAVHAVAERSSPMYLVTSDKESPEYRRGLNQLAEALARAKVDHQYVEDADGRGHKVSVDGERLRGIFDFFHKQLDGAAANTSDRRN